MLLGSGSRAQEQGPAARCRRGGRARAAETTTPAPAAGAAGAGASAPAVAASDLLPRPGGPRARGPRGGQVLKELFLNS